MKNQRVVDKAIEMLKSNAQITSLDVKNELRNEFPNEDWSQAFVGESLRESDRFIVLDNSNGYNIYAEKIQPSKPKQIFNFIKNLF